MLATIIISAIIFGAMGMVIYRQIKNFKSGKRSCSCGCSDGCPGCGSSNTCTSNKK